MPDAPSETPPEARKSKENAEILVGDVNTSFEPLRPEDIMPASSASTDDAAPPPEVEIVDQSPPPPPLETTTDSSDQKLWGCLRDILLVLVSVFLGAAFALVILLGLNGTLFLNDRDKTAYLEVSLDDARNQQDALAKQAGEQQEAIAAAETRMQELDAGLQALDGRVQTLEEEQQSQSSDIESIQTRVGEIEQEAVAARQEVAAVQERQAGLENQVSGIDEQVSVIEDDIADVKETAARFDRFVQGLVALIAEVAPEELRPTETITPTATPSSPTVVPESTPEASTEAEAPPALELFPPRVPLPTPVSGAGLIFGLTWLDANENGAPDADETALPGQRILLKDANDNLLLSMITGVDGRFAFINVSPGDYWVAIDADEDALTTSYAYPLTLSPDGRMEVNFGLIRP